VPFESLGAASYSLSIVTMAVSVAVCEIFSVKKWCDLENEKIAFLYERLWRETNGETNGQTDGQNQRVKLRKGGLIIIR